MPHRSRHPQSRSWRQGEIAGLLLSANRAAEDAATLARVAHLPPHLQDQLDAFAKAARRIYRTTTVVLRPEEGGGD